MQQNFTMNDLQTLLYFPFKDSNSRSRLLIASAVGLAGFIIPIVPWLFILGYAGAIMKQIIVDKQEPSMPDWKNWNEYISLGVKLFGVNIIYAIPAFIPMLFGYGAMMLPAFMDAFSRNPHTYSNPDQFLGITMLFSFGGFALFGIGMLFSIIIWIFLPPALAHVVAKDSFAAGFQFPRMVEGFQGKYWWFHPLNSHRRRTLHGLNVCHANHLHDDYLLYIIAFPVRFHQRIFIDHSFHIICSGI